MVILTAEGLSKSYGVDLLFDGVSFGISDTDKIGIVGANGAGKSTLLRILVGQEAPDTGQIALNRQARVEILAQQPDLQDDLTALEQVLTDGPAEFQVAQRYAHALAQLAERPQDHALLDKLSLLQQEMDRVGAWTLESEARIILTQLGLDDPHQRVGAMSGGQQKRVALARALIRPSDLLILDEPTNHLDVQTVAWLERYLAQRPGALLMVTHDRYVLDRVANVIFELAEGALHRHEANYSTFVQTRAQRMIEREQAHHRLTQLAKKELEWLRRGPKARTTKARSRVDRATALQEAAAQGPEGLRKVELDAVSQRLGKKIVELEAVSKSFEGRLVLAPFSYVFSRGERLGLVGPNGAGKSTLLNLITGQLEPDAGERQVGQSVVFGYYDQRAQRLDESERVYDYIAKRSNVITTREGSLSASQMLERFLFSRARQYSPISKLSGGERRRLYLLRVLMEQPNVLILDEPTNDLDIETLTVLEDFLDQFEGVLIVVSHDRYFLDRTVEHLLVFEGQGRLVEFPGNMSQWLEAQQTSPQTSPQTSSQAASRTSGLEGASGQPQASSKAQGVVSSSTSSAPATAPATPAATKPRQKLSYKDQRDLDALPGQIEALEAKLAALDAELSLASSDYARLESLSADRAQLAATLEAALERWMALEELVGS